MNVPNIAQGPAGAITSPRTDAGGDLRPYVVVRAPAPGPTSQVSFTRLAWFDANGDGEIDPRSAAAGGDATLIVPSRAVDLPTYTRPAPASTRERARVVEPAGREPVPGNAAQTSRAIDAYQRYGQSPPASPPAATPPPVPVPPVAATVGGGADAGSAPPPTIAFAPAAA